MRDKPKPPQINEKIWHNTLRVVLPHDEDNTEIMTTQEALRLSGELGLDLVVISDKATPPIAKVLDANKYFYEQKRKEKDAAKRQRENRVDIKEVQFRPNIGDHDLEIKTKQISKFLERGDKVKCMVRYRGRENANKQTGFEILERVVKKLSAVEWDSKPALNGNRLIGILKRGKNAEQNKQ